MITIFSTLKPITDATKNIQKNALSSWKALHKDVEIIIYGSDKGISSLCKDFKIKQVKSIRQTRSKIPYVSDIFKSAQEIAKHNIVMYANADMIFTKDLVDSIKIVDKQFEKYLIVGKRINLDLKKLVNFNHPQAVMRLLSKAKNDGQLHDHTGIDYFIFPRNLFKKIPDMYIGRNRWDNWTVAEGKKLSGALIDATKSINAIHQNHDYSNVDKSKGRKTKKYISETKKNIKLTQGQFASILDANYKLINNRIISIPSFIIEITKKIDFLYRIIDRKLNKKFGFGFSPKPVEVYKD